VLAAGPAIARQAREALAAGRESNMLALIDGDPSQVTGVVITRAAREGDALAREILDRAGFYIGMGIVNLLHGFDTELFVLGGSVAEHAWEFLYPAVVSALDKHAIPSIRKGVRVVVAQLGGDVGLLGAAAIVISTDPPASER
jgi:glucokinase